MTAPRSSADPATRRRVVAIARDWIGTPYRNQASMKGAGADCLGLIRGVWRALYGQEPQALLRAALFSLGAELYAGHDLGFDPMVELQLVPLQLAEVARNEV